MTDLNYDGKKQKKPFPEGKGFGSKLVAVGIIESEIAFAFGDFLKNCAFALSFNLICEMFADFCDGGIGFVERPFGNHFAVLIELHPRVDLNRLNGKLVSLFRAKLVIETCIDLFVQNCANCCVR